MEDSEQRLAMLEENVYFLEADLKKLDAEIAAQSAQLEKLAANVEQLGQAVAGIRDFVDSAHIMRENPGEDLPPHHVARFW